MSWFWTKPVPPARPRDRARRRRAPVAPAAAPRAGSVLLGHRRGRRGDGRDGAPPRRGVRHRRHPRAARRCASTRAWNAWKLARALDRPSLALLREVVRAYAEGRPPPDDAAGRGGGDRGPAPRRRRTWRSAGRGRRRASSDACARRRPGRARGRRSATPSWSSCARAATEDFPRALEPGEAAVRDDGIAVVRAGRRRGRAARRAARRTRRALCRASDLARIVRRGQAESRAQEADGRPPSGAFPLRGDPAYGSIAYEETRTVSDVVTLARTARESLARGLNALQGDPQRPAAARRSRGAHRAGHGRPAPDRELGRGRSSRRTRRRRSTNVQSALAPLQAQPPHAPGRGRGDGGGGRRARAACTPSRAPAQPQQAAPAPPRASQQYAPVPAPAARGTRRRSAAYRSRRSSRPTQPPQQPPTQPPAGARLRLSAAAAGPAAAPLPGPGRSRRGDFDVVAAELGRAQPEQLLQGPLGQRHRRPRRAVRLDVQAAQARDSRCACGSRCRAATSSRRTPSCAGAASRATAGATRRPGFGAQFTEITPEARQLVYRYVRNREPMFHDDL